MAAEMWYYTAEGKQMDPVSIRELRRLVDDGLLKPTDMVWKDGMARWIRASSVKELFPDPGSELDKYFASADTAKVSGSGSSPAATPSSAPVVPAKRKLSTDEVDDDPRPQRRRRRAASEDEGDRPSRRGAEPKGGNSGLILIAVLLGGGLVLFAAVVGVLILIFANGTPARPAGAAVENPVPERLVDKKASYVEPIPPLGVMRRTIKLQRGVTYEFSVRSEPRHVDVDLFILDDKGAIEDFDDSPGPDSFKRYVAREDGNYKVELRNLDDFSRAQSTVTIREVAGAPPDKKPNSEPLPKDVLTANGSLALTALKPADEQIFKIRVKGGTLASVNVSPYFKKAEKLEMNLNIFVMKDSDGSKICEDTQPGRSVKVQFTLPADETVRVRIHNAGKATASRGMILYKTAP